MMTNKVAEITDEIGMIDNENAGLSYEDLSRKIIEIEGNFVSPSPQTDLDGKLGVKLEEVAQSLGVSYGDLKRKITRSNSVEKIKALGYDIRSTLKIPKSGSRSQSYVMEVGAAQHIVAKYNNPAGWLYVEFLLRCKSKFQNFLENTVQDDSIDHELKIKKMQSFLMLGKYKKKKAQRKDFGGKNSDWYKGMIDDLKSQRINSPSKSWTADLDQFRHLCSISAGNAKSMIAILKRTKCDYPALKRCVRDLNENCKKIKELTSPDLEALG